MFERFTPVNQCIKYPFVIGLESFSDDSDELLKNAPDALGNGKLNDTVRGFMKKPSDGLISGKALDRAQDVVLKYRYRYAGNLGGEVPGLGFAQPEQAFAFFEKNFYRPSH